MYEYKRPLRPEKRLIQMGISWELQAPPLRQKGGKREVNASSWGGSCRDRRSDRRKPQLQSNEGRIKIRREKGPGFFANAHKEDKNRAAQKTISSRGLEGRRHWPLT